MLTTTTATRSGTRVRVHRIDDVIAGAEPIVSIMTDDLDIMNFSPETATALAGMLLRAAATTVALGIYVQNSYPALGTALTHELGVVVPAPSDDEDLHIWALAHLIPHTGEGADYAAVYGVYQVEITSAPHGFEHLVGFDTCAMG